MKKLYEKSELSFALVLIGAYCALQSLANPLNRLIGVNYAASALFCGLQAVFLWRFIQKNNLARQYGICKSPFPARRFLYYLPLVLLATQNLWNGWAVNFPPIETACYITCMLFVGFVEEVLVRGFLFKALAKDGVKKAILISSITFGLAHLLNLINGSGAQLAENLFQVTGAIAIGFLFVLLFHRGQSILPCILTHAAINITSAFARGEGLTAGRRILFHFALFALTAGYALLLTRTLPAGQSGDSPGREAENEKA